MDHTAEAERLAHEAERLAQLAYTAYGHATGGKNFLGDPMPAWGALPDTIRAAWTAAAIEVQGETCHRVAQHHEGTADTIRAEARLADPVAEAAYAIRSEAFRAAAKDARDYAGIL